MKDLSEMMRLQLAGHGIAIDATPVAPARPAPRREYKPDYHQIRAILEPKVPAGSLDWLTLSCPSVQDAIKFQMPRLR